MRDPRSDPTPNEPLGNGCQHNYVVSAQKPTSVTHSARGHFTSATAVNLIVGKCTRIEVYVLLEDGLQGLLEVPVYGRISCMELLRLGDDSKDVLFVATERYKFFIVEYEETSGELITRGSGDARGLSGRPTDSGQIGIVDPDNRVIGLYLYEGLFKVIPVHAGQLKEAFDARLEELEIIDLKFMYGCARPTLAVLYQDPKGGRHFKTYEIRDKDFLPGALSQSQLDPASSMILPVHHHFGGAVVVGETSMTYISTNNCKAVPTHHSTMRVSCCLDTDGSRYLLADSLGVLYLLLLQHDTEGVTGLTIEPIGHGSPASSLSYMDKGIVFVGSAACDSQLIRLNRSQTSSEICSSLEVLETFTNLGPIVDFCVMDMDRQGQGQVVTCSGVFNQGTLRVIKNGIGINEQANIEIPGMKGLWCVISNKDGYISDYLIVTFAVETRCFLVTNLELREVFIAGIDERSATIYCRNLTKSQIVQVTHSAVSVISLQSGSALSRWTDPSGSQIDVATAGNLQIVLGMQDCRVVYLEVQNGSLVFMWDLNVHSDISCVDLFSNGANDSCTMLAVGTWAMDIAILSLENMQILSKFSLEEMAVPRSLKHLKFENDIFLLCALSDGHLLVYSIDLVTGILRMPRRISLGVKSITLHSFTSNGMYCVFAACDRPSVIYFSNNKLLYSNLNDTEVNCMSSFSSASLDGSLAIGTDKGLQVGTIDTIQKLHIQTVPLGEQPRRIAYQESTKMFGVLTIHTDMLVGDIHELHESSYLRLIDGQTFEVCDSFKLDMYETGCAIADLCLDSDSSVYFVVGTAFVLPEESEPSKGRLLVFKVHDKCLHLCSDREVKGAVYNVSQFRGGVIAGINSRVQLFFLVDQDQDVKELQPQCCHLGHVLALHVETRGDFIVVGDLMKSMSLLLYKPLDNAIEELARDYNSSWMTSVKILDDDTYLGAENGYNLFLLQKNNDSASDEERMRLEVVGEFHVGDLVNRFRTGSLVMKLPDTEPIITTLFGTINGVLGIVASLPENLFQKAKKLQDSMRKVIKGVGDLNHAEWRSFENERKIGTGHAEEQRCFIDGDLIEQFLDLRREKMHEVSIDIGDMDVDEICKLVEDLARLH